MDYDPSLKQALAGLSPSIASLVGQTNVRRMLDDMTGASSIKKLLDSSTSSFFKSHQLQSSKIRDMLGVGSIAAAFEADASIRRYRNSTVGEALRLMQSRSPFEALVREFADPFAASRVSSDFIKRLGIGLETRAIDAYASVVKSHSMSSAVEQLVANAKRTFENAGIHLEDAAWDSLRATNTGDQN